MGTETQILTPDIYNKVNQEKFIPIKAERPLHTRLTKGKLPSFLFEDLYQYTRFQRSGVSNEL